MVALRNRVALLTGATGGLGPAIARALAREGMDLALSARGEPALEALCRELEAEGVRCAPLAADLGDRGDVAALPDRVADALGPIDLLVHNAAGDVCASFERTTSEEIRDLVDVNLTAPLELTRRVVEPMRERGRGHVVFVASISGYTGTAYEATYAATKGALIALSRSLRAEYVDEAVSFSVVSPGSVAGQGIFARAQADGLEVPGAMKLTTPEKVADAVVRAAAKDLPEVVVYPGPIKPGLALGLLAPRAFEHINERLGLGRMFRPAAVARGRA